MADVFISYASQDRATAKVLATGFGRAGFTVWYDPGLGGDKPFHEQIAEQINLAGVVVAVWSANSAESKWVYSEAAEADAANKLINVTADRTVPPMPFNRLNGQNLVGWDGDLNAVCIKNRLVTAKRHSFAMRRSMLRLKPQRRGAGRAR